jgi:hypothetical protein
VRLGSVGDVIAHSSIQDDRAAILQFGAQFAALAQQKMAFLAPVVGDVAGGVLHQSHPDVAELPGPPGCRARIARIGDAGQGGPINAFEGDILEFHGASIAKLCQKTDAL